MDNKISDKIREKITSIAELAEFSIQLKEDGSDVYVKNLMFSSDHLVSYLYIRKDVQTNDAGEPDYLQIAIHPDDFRLDLIDPTNGIEELINRKTGKNLFCSSNYRGFPLYPDSKEPCGKCYRVKDYQALALLFKGLISTQTTPGNLLRSITLENFKGVREPVRIEFKPITLLFGPNSAGKSTIVQSLHYAHEILERENVDPDHTLHGGQAIELGGFESLVHKHDTDREIKLTFELDLKKEELPIYRLGYVTSHSDLEGLFAIENRIESASITLIVRWSQILQKPQLKAIKLKINNEDLTNIVASDDGKSISLSNFWTNHPIFWPEGEEEDEDGIIPQGELGDVLVDLIREQYLAGGSFLFTELAEMDSPLPNWGMPLELNEEIWEEDADEADKREIIEKISSLVVGPLELLRESIEEFIYLGPLRTVPPRNYTPVRSPVESRWAHGLAAWDLLLHDDGLRAATNFWLSHDTRFKSGYQIEAKKYKLIDSEGPLNSILNQFRHQDDELVDYELIQSILNDAPTRKEIKLIDTVAGVKLEPYDLGVGLSQLIPVIVAILHAKFGIVAVEQPELHIHPAWQVVLGDLYANQIERNSSSSMPKDALYLVETHSEHLMLRLLRRIRETTDNELEPGAPKLTPDDVAVYYASHEDGITNLQELRIDKDGEFIDKWPAGFFEERAEELF